jgi:hypothetical protein
MILVKLFVPKKIIMQNLSGVRGDSASGEIVFR